MAAELAGLLLPFLGVVRRLLVVEARILGLDGGEAQLNGLVEEITKGLKPKGEKRKSAKRRRLWGTGSYANVMQEVSPIIIHTIILNNYSG